MGIIIASVAGLIIGAALGYLLFRYVLKQTYNQSINSAKSEAEAIKSQKLLEVKEKFLNKKAELEKERRIQEAQLAIKRRFGKNAILRGLNFEEGATAKERNEQIGGHKA